MGVAVIVITSSSVAAVAAVAAVGAEAAAYMSQ